MTNDAAMIERIARRRDDLHQQQAREGRTRHLEVVRPSPMVVPEPRALRREPPRSPEDMQADYLEKFDAKTLFYDAFRVEDDIWLCGPPMRNLRGPVRRRGTWSLDGREVDADRLQQRDWVRTQRTRLLDPGPGRALALDMQGFTMHSQVGDDGAGLFAGRHTVTTKSCDNDLVWITDWLHYYHEVHGVTGVVLYENNSTRYRAEDVLEAVAAVPGIEVGIVVDWQFPWGPNGGPHKKWDSDFSQYAMLEHARHRYLRNAAGVVNCDIDELVLTDDGRTVFEHAAEVPSGVLRYSGVFIAKRTDVPLDPERQRRFRDYHYRIGGDTTAKWTTIPAHVDLDATQWRVHNVAGCEPDMVEDVVHRHYQGVNNGWKYDRTETVADPDELVRDTDMEAVLELVYGDR